ncbi:hypothetical protein NUSPORA_02926 [Nucleospora cyclopteri]
MTSVSLKRIKSEMIRRIEKLCKTKSNATNLMKIINKHSISIINYHVGISAKLNLPTTWKRSNGNKGL